MANNLGISDYTVGGDYDSWGDKIIADLARLNKAAGDVLTITTATGTVTLTQDQSNNAVHRLTATLTGNVIVETLAGLSRYWVVRNATSGAFSVTYRVAGGAGASASITQGRTAIVWCDGTDCSIFDLSTLSGLVTTAQITDANVTTAKLADSAVTTVKIADANVTTVKIADGNVTTAKVADSGITTAKIADANVTTAKIADANVTAAKLASGAALSNLATNSVTKAKLEQIASYRVLGNVTGALANVAEVIVSNDPTMAAASQTSLVTEYATKTLIASTAFSSALPGQAGNAGKFVTTDGTNASWVTITLPTYSTLRVFEKKSGNFSAAAFYRYRCETGSGSITATLPASPTDGDIITIRRKGTNTVVVGRNGKTIAGDASDLTIDADKREVDLKYNATTSDWEVEARAYT